MASDGYLQKEKKKLVYLVCPSGYSQQQLGDLLSQKFLVGLQVNIRDQPWADPLFGHSYAFGLITSWSKQIHGSMRRSVRYICVLVLNIHTTIL